MTALVVRENLQVTNPSDNGDGSSAWNQRKKDSIECG
jgi:hypothetical protein